MSVCFVSSRPSYGFYAWRKTRLEKSKLSAAYNRFPMKHYIREGIAAQIQFYGWYDHDNYDGDD